MTTFRWALDTHEEPQPQHCTTRQRALLATRALATRKHRATVRRSDVGRSECGGDLRHGSDCGQHARACTCAGHVAHFHLRGRHGGVYFPDGRPGAPVWATRGVPRRRGRGCAHGGYAAVVLSFRFAAADGVPPSRRARALSLVMAGGVVAGVVGPQLVTWTMDIWPQYPFAPTFLAQAAVAAVSALILRGVKLPMPTVEELEEGAHSG